MIERDQRVTIRFTQDELDIIDKRCKIGKKTRSKYIRDAALSEKIELIDAMSREDKHELSKLKKREQDILKELKTQGRNLNQLTKAMEIFARDIDQGNKGMAAKIFNKKNKEFEEFRNLLSEMVHINKQKTEQS